jgi:hypothetical protein
MISLRLLGGGLSLTGAVLELLLVVLVLAPVPRGRGALLRRGVPHPLDMGLHRCVVCLYGKFNDVMQYAMWMKWESVVLCPG